MNQNKILEYFSLLISHNLLGSSYLFIGNNSTIVKDVIKLINCKDNDLYCGQCWDCKKIEDLSHPDIFNVKPSPLSIKIESIRESIRFLSLKSFCLRRKVILLEEAESLSSEASSAFLKTLEEPPANSFIAICTSKLEGMLPTIISRCRKIFLPFYEGGVSQDYLIPQIRDFLRGVNVKFKNRREFAGFLWILIVIFRDKLVAQTALSNNRLLKNREYEIIPKLYNPAQIYYILKDILKIYGAYNSVNENLALNMIRLSMEK
ncbi:MAG: hypothetical protein ABIH71_04565 [Candidatus Omnitrophota bacterium]|nr:hypothetical protein [Candidatus Omnitrophota bacterium]